MTPKTLKKLYNIEVGKTYKAGNDEKVTVTGVGRNVYSKEIILFCKVEKNGILKDYDAKLNSIHGWKGWAQ